MMTTRVVTLRKCPMCKQYYSKRCLPEMEESEELEYSIEANEKKCAECTHLMQRYSSCGPHVMVIQMGGNKMQEAVDTLANVLSSHLAIGNQCYRKVLPDELYDLTSCEKTLQSMSLLYRVSKRFSIVPISSANSQLQVVFSLPAWGSICVKCPEDQSFSENSAGIRSLRKSSVIGTINLTKNQASSVKIDGLITSWYSIQISKVEGQVSLMCESSFLGGMILGLCTELAILENVKFASTIGGTEEMGVILFAENKKSLKKIRLGDNADVFEWCKYFPVTRAWDNFLRQISKTTLIFS